MKTILFVSLLGVLFLYACTEETNNNIIEKIKTERTDSVKLVASEKKYKLKLPKQIINQTQFLQLINNKETGWLLAYFERNNNTIYFFRLDSGTIYSKIKIPTEGPNAIPEVIGFQIKTMDSIFISPKFQRNLVIINSKGDIINRYDYSKLIHNEPVSWAVLNSSNNNCLVFKNENIYIPIDPVWDEPDFGKKNPEEMCTMYKYNTKTNIATPVKIGFPKTYWENGYLPILRSGASGNNNIFINFIYSHELYVSNDFETWKSYNLRSKYIEDIGGRKRKIDHPILNSRYLRTIYDRYRNIYYRFVILADKDNLSRSIQDRARYPKATSIMILDSEFNIICETLMPEDIYDESGWFIMPEGLYLSTAHLYNPNYKEDEITYQLLTVENNEK